MKRQRPAPENGGSLHRRWARATFLGCLVSQIAVAAVAADGVVALQTAAPSCSDDSGMFYVNCGNGTVTDNRSGLVWLEDADCLGFEVDWRTAMGFVAGLGDMPDGSIAEDDDCGLSDGSSPGDWRLASFEEWRTMVEGGIYGELDCTPALTNDQGDACWSHQCWVADDCSFRNVHVGAYWTGQTIWFSSLYEEADLAYYIDTEDGDLEGTLKTLAARLWPVRDGQ